MKQLVGTEGLFWVYGGISALGLAFIFLTVPETKGRTEAQIREFFLSAAERKERSRRRRGGERQVEEGGGGMEEEESPLNS